MEARRGVWCGVAGEECTVAALVDAVDTGAALAELGVGSAFSCPFTDLRFAQKCGCPLCVAGVP